MRRRSEWRSSEPVKRAAKTLRQEMTEAERVLWLSLRAGRLGGFHFRRQHAVGPFILDFFCAAAGLCVELDGAVHDGREVIDQARTEALATRGIRVIRFRNDEVLSDLPRVLERISSALPETR